MCSHIDELRSSGICGSARSWDTIRDTLDSSKSCHLVKTSKNQDTMFLSHGVVIVSDVFYQEVQVVCVWEVSLPHPTVNCLEVRHRRCHGSMSSRPKLVDGLINSANFSGTRKRFWGIYLRLIGSIHSFLKNAFFTHIYIYYICIIQIFVFILYMGQLPFNFKNLFCIASYIVVSKKEVEESKNCRYRIDKWIEIFIRWDVAKRMHLGWGQMNSNNDSTAAASV